MLIGSNIEARGKGADPDGVSIWDWVTTRGGETMLA
jgi:hypothetical protein